MTPNHINSLSTHSSTTVTPCPTQSLLPLTTHQNSHPSPTQSHFHSHSYSSIRIHSNSHSFPKTVTSSSTQSPLEHLWRECSCLVTLRQHSSLGKLPTAPTELLDEAARLANIPLGLCVCVGGGGRMSVCGSVCLCLFLGVSKIKKVLHYGWKGRRVISH